MPLLSLTVFNAAAEDWVSPQATGKTEMPLPLPPAPGTSGHIQSTGFVRQEWVAGEEERCFSKTPLLRLRLILSQHIAFFREVSRGRTPVLKMPDPASPV